jgi:hypothetical protein
MLKRTLIVVGFVLVVAAAWSVNGYAAEGEVTAWEGFWNSVGGFFYNALPWNWGNWMGGGAK